MRNIGQGAEELQMHRCNRYDDPCLGLRDLSQGLDLPLKLLEGHGVECEFREHDLEGDFEISAHDPWQELGRLALGLVRPDFGAVDALGEALLRTVAFAFVGVGVGAAVTTGVDVGLGVGVG